MKILAVVALQLLLSRSSASDFQWGTFEDVVYDYNFEYWPSSNYIGWTFAEKRDVDSVIECQDFCEEVAGCSFVVYSDGACQVKIVDQTKWTRTIFKGQSNFNFLPGEIRNVESVGVSSNVESTADCGAICDDSLDCQFATYDTSKSECETKAFFAGGETISFRMNPRALNDRPLTEGILTTAGNTGIVGLHASLLPTGKILLGARPEYWKNAPNTDNILAGSPTASGEIASLYDPVSEASEPIRVDDNLFCHAQVLTPEGDVFSAGGDADAFDNLAGGLDQQRLFITSNSTFTYGKKMQKTRWYPSIVRTTLGQYWIIGGQVIASPYEIQANMEIYTPGVEDEPNDLIEVELIQRKFEPNYLKPAIIPGTGHVFIFGMDSWTIFDMTSKEMLQISEEGTEQTTVASHGGWFPAANAILPMYATEDIEDQVCEFALFGGGYWDEDFVPRAVDHVTRMVITNDVREWTYEEPMPYGRIVSDAVIQPNGKILIMNGGRHGTTAGGIGLPVLYGTASEVFCYDPAKPAGQRWEVFAKSPNRRFYHSSAVFVPDGTTIIMGTDEATYDPSTSYDHEAERFTPPWLLDGSPRPTITAAPEDVIYYGTEFTFEYELGEGAVLDKVSLMAPGSATHGTEMTQRLLFLLVARCTANSITVRAPLDATVMTEGYYMLFAIAGDTPSEARWVRIGNAPEDHEFPPLTPLDPKGCSVSADSIESSNRSLRSL